MREHLNKAREKIREVNEKAEKIINSEKMKKIDSEEFYKQNLLLIEKVKNFLKETNYNLTNLNKKQEKAVEEMELESIKKNVIEKNKIEEDIIKIGKNINNMFESVTPTGFMKIVAKEILDSFKEIDKKIKDFNKKIEEFQKKLIEKEINKEIETIKNFDTQKVKKNGIFGLNDEVLKSITKISKLQKELFKTNIIDDETATMLKNGQFEEIGKKIVEKAIPMATLVSSLIDFNKKTREIIEGIADFVKDKSQQLGISGSQIIQNQLQDIDTDKVRKISGIISDFADKIPHPYAQAVAKGAKVLKNTLNTSAKSQKIEKERNISRS